MKTYSIEGQRFEAPRYVVRAGSGWVFRPPGAASQSFADSRFGGPEKALEHARVAATNLLGSQVLRYRDPAQRERDAKLRPLGVPGVFLQVDRRARPGSGGSPASERVEYKLRVVLSGRVRILYVGTAKTWEARLDVVIEKAKALRQAHHEK